MLIQLGNENFSLYFVFHYFMVFSSYCPNHILLLHLLKISALRRIPLINRPNNKWNCINTHFFKTLFCHLFFISSLILSLIIFYKKFAHKSLRWSKIKDEICTRTLADKFCYYYYFYYYLVLMSEYFHKSS